MGQNGILKNTIYYSIGEILPRVISFLLLPLYTRYLTPSDYGIMSYIATVYSFLLIFSTLSLNSYVLRCYFVHTDDKERRDMIGTIHISIILFNLCLIGLGYIFLPSVIDYYQIQVPWDPFFKMALAINFLDSFTIIPMVVYRVRQEALKFVTLGVSRSFFTVIMTIYFVVYQGRGVLGTFEAQLYVYLFYLFIYLYTISKYANVAFKKIYLIEGLKFSLPLLPGAICFVLLNMSDRIILERNVGIGQLGIYNIACTMSLALNVIIMSGYKAIEPEMFKRYGKDGYYDFVKKVQSLYFGVIYIGAFTLCLFSQEAFYIMTSESFHEGYWLVPALIIGVIMTGHNTIYGGILLGEQRTKEQGLATVIGSIVSVSLNLLLVPFWGVYAAAAVSAISFLVMNSYLFYQMTFPGKSMTKEMIIVLLIPLVSYAFFNITGEVCLIGFVIKLFALIIVSAIILYVLRVRIETLKLFIKR